MSGLAKDVALSRPLSYPLVDLVAARLRLLGQPVRVRLIERFDRLGEAHVQQLADELGETQQNMSKHLAALWRVGVLARRRDGRVTVYSLVDAETFALIERVATGVAIELRELMDDTSSGANGT